MTKYGPGEKRKEETYSEYNNRINVKLLKFIKEAIAKANSEILSPFSGLHYDAAGNIVDSLNHRSVFLVIHAGSSYLTDGGEAGSSYRDSPFDMIDAFITPDYLGAYKDTLGLDSAGVMVKGKDGNSLLIDEIMMVSETSNQDSLNFGIHGILVNQLARQIGIPDLYSTASGVTGVGAFCIMDFYGYSVGQGFIPPWPSAWVRAFMGWETPVVASMGLHNSFNLKAVCLGQGQTTDTTILLVPINDHEYYLLENRQRSLIGGPDIFKYDTTDSHVYIDGTFSLNLANNIVKKSDTSSEILDVKNYDASLPASGIVVWHVDENVIRDRLKYDYLNADSSYRAVSLVEADGVNDIGYEFSNYYQLFYDYGGAEDVFPHRTINKTTASGSDSTFTVKDMGPWSKPSTVANDGGKTYLSMSFDTLHSKGIEVSNLRSEYYVDNYIDSAFRITVSWDYLVSGWPKRTLADSGEGLFDPLVCDIYKSNTGKEIISLSKKGRLYIWPAISDSSQPSWFGDTMATVGSAINAINPSLNNSYSSISTDTMSFDTLHYFQLKSPGGAFTFPTVINNKLFIPLKNASEDTVGIDVISSVSQSKLYGDIIPIKSVPSTYICKLEGNYWIIGCKNGSVFAADTANYFSDTATVTLGADTPSAVCALAALQGEAARFVCIQNNSVLSLCSVGKNLPLATVKIVNGIAPYSLVTGDINNDDTNEIIVCDSRKGLWAFKHDLTPASGWKNMPNDEASPYDTASDRRELAINLAPPALADINGDGYLDIIAGGSNGMFALNYKGIAISGWPSYLDNRYFHGNITCSPAIMSAPAGDKSPVALFSSPSGENETFQIGKIMTTNKTTGKIVFSLSDGSIDSTYATASFIDSATTLSDSLVTIVALYGGLVDAINPSGSRPVLTIGTNQTYSRWPLTVGTSIGASPLIDNSMESDSAVNLIATASNGWIYRWKLDTTMAGKTLFWKQTGYDGSRPFAYSGSVSAIVDSTSNAPVTLYSWPNPAPDINQTKGRKVVNFKYKFSGTAKNVRLDIFTYTGFHVFSRTNLSGSYPDWNELPQISLDNFGSGVYRCRMEAEINGKKYAKFWKMAIVK
jgi:hypothetical protein